MGKQLYLTITRPDITYAVVVVSARVSNVQVFTPLTIFAGSGWIYGRSPVAKEEGTKLPYEVGAEAERLEKRKAIQSLARCRNRL